MPTFTMQKQAARNLVLSPKIQLTWGEYLADAAMTLRQRFNPSTVFTKDLSRRSDQMAAGKGSEFATNTQITARDTKGTLTSEADAELLGWMMALLFGVETVTGVAPGPYTHTFSIPLIDATMQPTTIYVEETADQKFEMCDMCASSLSLTVPERGAITAALDMVGTGRSKAYVMASMAATPQLPALAAANYLLGSDMQISITPSGGAATPFVGRQKSLSIKVDRQAKPFQSSGEGDVSSSVASGLTKFAIDFTVAANETDEVNGWFEDQTALAITIATNPANPFQVGFTFPAAYAKSNKLGNAEDKVMWALAFDETSCLQSGATPAISAFVINNTPAYLIGA